MVYLYEQFNEIQFYQTIASLIVMIAMEYICYNLYFIKPSFEIEFTGNSNMPITKVVVKSNKANYCNNPKQICLYTHLGSNGLEDN